MNALADPRIRRFLNDNFICTYLKVGTFEIINGRKVGGNVASYYCLHDGGVIHAIPGPVSAAVLLSESHWVCEIRKLARTTGSNLGTDAIDMKRYRDTIAKAHSERVLANENSWARQPSNPGISSSLQRPGSLQAQVHWLLARQPLTKLDRLYPVVWTQVLREKLSGLPVTHR